MFLSPGDRGILVTSDKVTEQSDLMEPDNRLVKYLLSKGLFLFLSCNLYV